MKFSEEKLKCVRDYCADKESNFIEGIWYDIFMKTNGGIWISDKKEYPNWISNEELPKYFITLEEDRDRKLNILI